MTTPEHLSAKQVFERDMPSYRHEDTPEHVHTYHFLDGLPSDDVHRVYVVCSVEGVLGLPRYEELRLAWTHLNKCEVCKTEVQDMAPDHVGDPIFLYNAFHVFEDRLWYLCVDHLRQAKDNSWTSP